MRKLTSLQQKLEQYEIKCQRKYDEPMCKHTSFRIGGGAEVMAFPKTNEELAEILNLSKLLDCNLRILGAGTNVLAPDEGLSGIVVCLKDSMDGMEALGDGKVRISVDNVIFRESLHQLQFFRL